MQDSDSMREPNRDLYTTERSEASKKWERLVNDKLNAIQLVVEASQSTIKEQKLLILVDLQGVYLAFHKWLSDYNVPIDDGLIIGRFAQLQIERAAKEVSIRLANSQPNPTSDFNHLFESIKINYADEKPYLKEGQTFPNNCTYLKITNSIELFYAPAPLKKIEWNLMKSARAGSVEAKNQLQKVKSGIISRKGVFERDYKVYDDFVANLKKSIYHSCSHEGFFGFYVGEHGLKQFDEKEVDIRIAIRVMDALHNNEADSICIISSDQDFMPLHERADDFGVVSFQADLAKFRVSEKSGSKFRSLNERFIRGAIEPTWPLEILTEAVSMTDIGHFSKHKFSEQELHALCDLHNELNDYKIKIDIKTDGNASLIMTRPA